VHSIPEVFDSQDTHSGNSFQGLRAVNLGIVLNRLRKFRLKANFSEIDCPVTATPGHPETRATLDLNVEVEQNVSFELEQ
jgi:hypothetical protein